MERLVVWVALVTMVMVAEGSRECKIKFASIQCQHRQLEGVVAMCDGHGLEDIVPYNIDKDTVYMALKNFNLKHLTRDSLAHLAKVECLDIVNSRVEVVDEDAFSGMTNLKELVLKNTRMNNSQTNFVSQSAFVPELLTIAESPSITKFNFRGLENLDTLKTLDIHGNGLKELGGDIFDLIHSVEHLDLSDNGMAYVDWAQLNALKSLTQLNLHGNVFQTIPEEVYGQFFNVKVLTLADNPLHCNCKLAWLKDYYETVLNKDHDYEFVRCASPGKPSSMSERALEEFTCDEPSVPMITWKKLDDGRFEVNCSASGDPAPELSLRLPTGQMVIVGPSGNLATLSTSSPGILMGPGPVQCNAVNSEGSVFAQEDLPFPDANSAVRLSVHSSLGLLVVWILTALLMD